MGAAEIARAALDAVCYQTRDLMEAMARDLGFESISRNSMDVAGDRDFALDWSWSAARCSQAMRN